MTAPQVGALLAPGAGALAEEVQWGGQGNLVIEEVLGRA